MLFGVRHGERADYVEEEKQKIEIQTDPHLSPKGVLQGQETGLFLQQKIDEYYNYLKTNNQTNEQENKIEAIIITSPFLRTLQTSFAIAQNLKYVHQNTIFIQRELSEFQASKLFPYDPQPKLFIQNRSKDDLQQYINLQEKGMQLTEPFFQDNQLIAPQYPEDNQQVTQRVSTVLNLMTNNYLNKFPFDKAVIIYVSHQTIVEEGIKFFKTQIEDQTVQFCGISQILFNGGKFECQEVLLKGENDQIKKIQ